MIKYLSLIFLFFILTPGIILSYPKKTNKYLIGLLHAVLFALSCKYVLNVTKEGMEQAEDEAVAEDKEKEQVKAKEQAKAKEQVKAKEQAKAKDGKKDESIIKEIKEEANTLKFFLGDGLLSDEEVINKINTMEGPPKIVGANTITGDGKTYLLFTNQKGRSNKLENLIKYDILDPEMKVINKFIKYHKDYPDI